MLGMGGFYHGGFFIYIFFKEGDKILAPTDAIFRDADSKKRRCGHTAFEQTTFQQKTVFCFRYLNEIINLSFETCFDFLFNSSSFTTDKEQRPRQNILLGLWGDLAENTVVFGTEIYTI